MGKATYGSSSCLSRAAAARRPRTGSHKTVKRRESHHRNAYGATAAEWTEQCQEAAQEVGLGNALWNFCSSASRVRSRSGSRRRGTFLPAAFPGGHEEQVQGAILELLAVQGPV